MKPPNAKGSRGDVRLRSPVRSSRVAGAEGSPAEGELSGARVSPEVILITLPGVSARKLRQLKDALEDAEIPSLVLSSEVAISTLSDVATGGFGAGAEFREGRDGPAHPDQLLLNATHQQVTRRGTVIQLSRNEFRLLAVLAKRSGEPISSRELSQQAFGENNQKSDHYLRMYVRLLRKRIEEDPAAPRYLLTHRATKGYRLAAPAAFLH